MKFNFTILIIVTITLLSCKNEDKYLNLIKQENELLNREIDRNYEIISIFSDKNNLKYNSWKHKCEEILKLKDTVLNNKNDEKILNFALNNLKNMQNKIVSEKKYDYNEFLNLNIDIDNNIENALFINKFLIVVNSYIERIIFLSNIRDYRFVSLNSIVIFDKCKYNVGEDVVAEIFIAAVDTTVKPIIKMNNGEYIDSIDGFGRGIYKTKALKKGINTIRGTYVVKHDFYNWIDSFYFQTDFLVK